MKPGDRVVVDIKVTHHWHKGAVKALNGLSGTVEEVKEAYGALVLVRFDAPVEPWHANSRPITHFHFGERELIPVPFGGSDL